VKSELERLVSGIRIDLLPMGTTGDRKRHKPLPQIGGKGLFTKELEDALLAGHADFAVHSLKDLPTELGKGLALAAVPKREDPRDAFISATGKPFAELRAEARVGTSSVRRAAMLRRARPDLRIESLRGNLDTRLRAVRDGGWDAIVVAAAGLHRMGWHDQITEYFEPGVLCPAVGQGALGIEARAGDRSTMGILAVLEDAWSRISTTVERALLHALGGGCQIPIAAHSALDSGRLMLSAIVIRPDGAKAVQVAESAALPALEDATAATVAERLGNVAAERLLDQGARAILDAAASDSSSLPSPQAP
jgi:hydroxymethylbilane synthase